MDWGVESLLLSLYSNKEISLGHSGCLDDWYSDFFFFWNDWTTKFLMSFRKFFWFWKEVSLARAFFMIHLFVGQLVLAVVLDCPLEGWLQISAPFLFSTLHVWNKAVEESACILKPLSYSKIYSLWRIMRKDKTNGILNVGIMVIILENSMDCRCL